MCDLQKFTENAVFNNGVAIIGVFSSTQQVHFTQINLENRRLYVLIKLSEVVHASSCGLFSRTVLERRHFNLDSPYRLYRELTLWTQRIVNNVIQHIDLLHFRIYWYNGVCQWPGLWYYRFRYINGSNLENHTYVLSHP